MNITRISVLNAGEDGTRRNWLVTERQAKAFTAFGEHFRWSPENVPDKHPVYCGRLNHNILPFAKKTLLNGNFVVKHDGNLRNPLESFGNFQRGQGIRSPMPGDRLAMKLHEPKFKQFQTVSCGLQPLIASKFDDQTLQASAMLAPYIKTAIDCLNIETWDLFFNINFCFN